MGVTQVFQTFFVNLHTTKSVVKMMRRILFLMFLGLLVFQPLFADNGQTAIALEQKSGSHSEYYPPADMPVVYFDSSDLQIILVGDGFADYYDVEIVSLGSMLTVIGTQMDGYGDNIDVSTLPIGDYRIVITSSNNNVYEGDFAIE